MSQWSSVALSDVCQIKPPKKEAKERLSNIDLVSFVPMNDLGICAKQISLNEERHLARVYSGYTYFADNDVLLAKITPCFENGKLGIAKGLTNGVGFGSSEFIVLRSSDALLPEYLFYFLSQNRIREDGAKVMTGAVGHKRVPNEFVESQKIILPPLPEQKRIVAILDEAFAGISQAVFNAEKNLTNARELFESYLNGVFTRKGEGWMEKRLSELSEVQSGGTPLKSKPEYWGGDIAWYSSGELNSMITNVPERTITHDGLNNSNAKLFPKGSLLIGMYDTAALKMSILDRDAAFNQAISGMKPEEGIDLKFVLHSVNAIKSDILSLRRGVRQKNLSLGKIKDIVIAVPDITKQKHIVNKLSTIEKEVSRLESIYQQKLTALTELKQSILQKAFAGELTADSVATSLKLEGFDTTSPEFTANILAYAYYRHTMQNREKTFGHVKAQKTLHLVESIGGIDLGRKPLKDAAGPNDFQHMLMAEEWAKANKLFEFLPPIERGYEFKKLSRYNTISKTFSALRPYRKKLEEIIDLLIPMNTEEAEVFATVHTAWNELIFRGEEFDDNEIIYEARDNWHPDKMNIPVSKFREAIRLIRAKKLVPDGTSKRICGQENLF